MLNQSTLLEKSILETWELLSEDSSWKEYYNPSQYLHTCVCRAERGRCLGGGAAVAEETPEDVAEKAELWRGGGGAEGGDHGG